MNVNHVPKFHNGLELSSVTLSHTWPTWSNLKEEPLLCKHNSRRKISPSYIIPSLSFILQIFPDPVEVVLSTEGTLTCVHEGKERLPSIVVEPTDVSEVESGELRWPPEDMDFDEDEDLFLEQCIPPANIADWGEDEEESSVIENPQQSTSLLGTYNSFHNHSEQELGQHKMFEHGKTC